MWKKEIKKGTQLQMTFYLVSHHCHKCNMKLFIQYLKMFQGKLYAYLITIEGWRLHYLKDVWMHVCKLVKVVRSHHEQMWLKRSSDWQLTLTNSYLYWGWLEIHSSWQHFCLLSCLHYRLKEWINSHFLCCFLLPPPPYTNPLLCPVLLSARLWGKRRAITVAPTVIPLGNARGSEKLSVFTSSLLVFIIIKLLLVGRRYQ